MGIRLGPHPDDFIWAGGIEDTFVPQTRPGHRSLDEYELMGHYDNWREDLALARDIGLKALRWGVPWYRVEPGPGEFDWRWVDEVLPYIVEELGITPIVDLMHYGCPLWLRREFANPDYPRAVASYATAFARRYGSLIKWYTPLNEPIVNSLMCGKRGLWPPYLRGDAGYLRIMLQLARGILATVEAIKEVDPNSIMVHVEAAGLSRAARHDLEALAVEENRRGYICYDLITGLVMPDHPLFPWLVRNGASPDDLASIASHAIKLDVMGLNFYPQWSTQEIDIDKKGRLAFRYIGPDAYIEQGGAGFAKLIEDYYNRYKVPIIITETSAHRSEEVRSRWLEASVAAVKQLRGRGVPVLGYTWFPLFTMIDWRYRFGRQPLENYRLELGLYNLDGDGKARRWEPTSLVEKMRSYVNNSEASVGPLTLDAT
ncbi:MAG TPA: family 1 glycosylhydrolase [Blastocatellia bacterium]|nr:family 1 glycosylhydrolase [Blastocatellia bacterium]